MVKNLQLIREKILVICSGRLSLYSFLANSTKFWSNTLPLVNVLISSPRKAVSLVGVAEVIELAKYSTCIDIARSSGDARDAMWVEERSDTTRFDECLGVGLAMKGSIHLITENTTKRRPL